MYMSKIYIYYQKDKNFTQKIWIVLISLYQNIWENFKIIHNTVLDLLHVRKYV
jgi:hypothetical protein